MSFRSILFAAGFCLLSILFAGCRATDWTLFSAPSDESVVATHGLVYWDAPEADPVRNSLDIYTLKDRPTAPTLVIVHGGGWHYGDNRCFGLYSAVGRTFAEKGYTVVMPNYRLSPKVQHPEHVRDVARAITWTKKNIAQYGGDPNTLYLLGHSAGGHLVSLVTTDESYLKPHGLSANDIAAVVSVSGVYEITPDDFEVRLGGKSPLALDFDQMAPIRGNPLPIKTLLDEGLAVKLDVFGPVFGYDAKVRAAASPLDHVRPGLPPFLVINAERDLPALTKQGDEFHAALSRAKVESTRLVVENRNHNSILFRTHEVDDPVSAAALKHMRPQHSPAP